MTNWLADPVACAIRLKDERGCNILAGRNEVLSRSTRVHMTEEPGGVTRWAWGHMHTRRVGNGISLNDGPEMMVEHANVASDLLRAAYANAGTHECGGKTMLELFWDELMAVYERLMTGQDAEEDVGLAQGIAFCIAVACNPYIPDIDAVRAQAAERWEAMEAEPPAHTRTPKTAEARAAARRARRGRA